jgi:hypothetical protein
MRARTAAAALAAAAGILAGASAGAQQTACNRQCLEGFVDRYIDAAIANDPQALPLARNVRYTENGQRLEIGDGHWRSLKSKGQYRLFVTDEEAGQVILLTTVEEDERTPEAGSPALFSVRLKVANNEITEIETYIPRRQGTGEQGNTAVRNLEAAGKPREQFLTAVPAAERMSRRDLIETANKYFTGMQQNDGKGDYPFADTCHRIENGAISTNAPLRPGQARPDPKTATGYSGSWTCREQFESGLLYFVTRIRDRRYVAVDRERGLVAAIAFFDHSAGETRRFTTPNGREVVAGPAQPWTWYIVEVFKVVDGQLDQIEALLQEVPYGMLSGWSTWEAGMSDAIQDVTR